MARLLKIALDDFTEPQDINNHKLTENDKATYDEGKGVQDQVVMTGPLSTVYTKALNLYFAKTEIDGSDTDAPAEIVPIESNGTTRTIESNAVATESAAIDTMISKNLADVLDKKDASEFVNSINVVPDSDDIFVNPNTIVMGTDAASVLKPETVEEVQVMKDRCEAGGKDFFVFVGPDSEGNDLMHDIGVQIATGDSDENAFNAGDQFKRATEAIYDRIGVEVVYGFSDLSKRLRKASKGV
jgi:hypothetical protein